MGAGADVAEGALLTTSAAATVIPDAWAVAGLMYCDQCDPDQMVQAAQAWFDTASELGDAVSACVSATKAVAGDWQGKDADAFTNKAADLSRQLLVDQAFSVTVGIAVLTVAALNYVRIAAMVVMAAALAVYAATILAEMASIVGDLGASEATEVAAALFAGNCETGLSSMDESFDGIEDELAAAIAGFLGGDAGTQAVFGNHDVGEELGQATVSGLGTITAGLISLGYQNLVGKYMGEGNILGRAIGVTDFIPGDNGGLSGVVGKVTQPVDPVSHN